MDKRTLEDLERRARIAARPFVRMPADEHFLNEDGFETFREWRINAAGEVEPFDVIVENITDLSNMEVAPWTSAH